MGNSSSLFYNSNNSDEETLYTRISPTDEQFAEQQARWNNLADYLIEQLPEQTGYPMSSWLQGSYKFGTQIRPATAEEEFDIDLGIYFEWDAKAQDGDYTPKALREFVQAALQEYQNENAEDVIEVVNPPKARCCRIRFKGNFHIDVPCYHLHSRYDRRMLATDDGWETSDPKALYLWFKNEFNDYQRAKVRRIIQYIKCWAALQFKEDGGRPSSVLLTVLIADAIGNLTDEEIAADDEALAATLSEILQRLDDDEAVLNPVNQSENLAERLTSDQMETFIEKLREFYNIAQAALKCSTKLEAAIKWSEAFDHFFPLPEEEELQKSASGAIVAYRMLQPDIKVVAVPKLNANKEFTGTNAIGPIPKDCNINFELLNPAALPAGSTVEWLVRNKGEEAAYVNDMGHRIQLGGVSVTRHSAYCGTHDMVCIIKQYGRIIGYRRIPVSIADIAMPRRNSILKPYYTKLRGRRR